jgi:ribosomal protein S12 methylthiotransferase
MSHTKEDHVRKIALVSLGCAKNLIDSEVMLGYLQQSGRYSLVTKFSDADIIIINTCGFIQPARQEAEQHFQQAAAIKRQNPRVKLIAAGCYIQKDKIKLQQKYPQIDLWTGVTDFHHIVQLIEDQPFDPEEHSFLYSHDSPRTLSTPSTWAYLKISEGCSHQCSFCTIPEIKGPYRSRTRDSILIEAKRLVDLGIREINLVSQDSTYYGRDFARGDGLASLLEHMDRIPELARVRVLYAYPEEITDSLLDAMQSEKVCSYIDSPFQHAAPSIIRSMKRGMDRARALKLIEKIRKKLPEAALRTTLIVGYPGEGKSEFKQLYQFVREARFDHLGVFTYSHEPGTSSYALGDQVPQKEKDLRRQQIMEIQAEISKKNLQRFVGKRLLVLLEGHLQDNKDVLIARTEYQAPEVDGVVIIPTPPSVRNLAALSTVEIQRADVYDLYGIFM